MVPEQDRGAAPERSRGAEFPRKAAHIAFFTWAFLLPFIPPLAAVAAACALIPVNALLLPRLLPSLFPAHRSENGRLEAIHYPAALAACILAAPSGDRWYLLPAAAWFALAVVDGCLGLAHARFRSFPLPWNPRKFLIGWLIGSAAAALPATWLWYTFVSPAQLWLPPLLCFLIGLIESLWFRVDDNFIVPFAATVLLALIPSPLAPEAASLWASASWMTFVLPIAFALVAFLARKLTAGGALCGSFCALLLVLAHPGLLLFLGLFFVLGISATSFRFAEKHRRGLSEPGGGKRGAAEVFGAAGMAAWMAPAAYAVSGMSGRNAALVCVAPLVAKTMDTVSSEIGKAWRGSTFTLWPPHRCEPGAEGGISLVGTGTGLIAALFASIPILFYHWGGAREIAALIVIALAVNVWESLYTSWVFRHGWDNGVHPNLMLTLGAAVMARLIFGT